MTAFVEHDSFRFEQQALNIRLSKDYPAGGYSAARINHAMPGDIAPIAWRSVHGPANEPRAVAFFKQAGYLAVGHHAASGYSQDKPVDLFKRLLESRDWLSGGCAARRRFVTLSGFLRRFTHEDWVARYPQAGNR